MVRPSTDIARDDPGPGRARDWIAAVLLVIVVAAATRYGTRVLDKDHLFDEAFATIPIDALIDEGWSVERAIDFEETKGPTLIWTYAVLGKLAGGELNDLRLVSVLFFVAGVVPLLLIARWCGLSGASFIATAGLYALLPYQTMLGQMVMSEPSFVFGALWLMWIVCWGLGDGPVRGHAIAGPVLFGVVLSLLLHNRIHAVAFAAAAVLVATERDGVRSWGWWLAALLAGLSRIPLWMRWDGLVSPQFQGFHHIGFDPESLTYLGAAMAVFTGILLVPALRLPGRRAKMLIGVGALVGLALGVAVRIDLAKKVVFLDEVYSRYLGIIASAVRIAPAGLAQHVLLAALATIGLASTGALAALAFARAFPDRTGIILRLTFWTLLSGWGMYGVTQGFVFDRYLAPWSVLLPVVLVACLRRPAMIVQVLLWLGIAAYMLGKRLVW